MVYFNYNGKIYKEGSAVIGADNRGLRYGDGVFETMKIIKKKLIFPDEHFARLWKGLKILQFEIPRHFTPELLQQEIAALVVRNNHENAARVRLSIIRGDGGLFDIKNHLPVYIIQTWHLATGNGEWNVNGLILGVYKEVKKSCDILSNLKHNNYLPYIMAALYAKKEKWNDAIILNSNEGVCDTTIANIFIIKNNIVYTPSLNEGCVAGVMRKIIMNKLESDNSKVIEKTLSLAEIHDADEVFLTNSLYNIRWVQRIEETSYGNTLTQKIFTNLKTI